MDEPPVVNGRVSSRELYAAISSLREELGSAQRAQTADVMAAVAATEQRLSARIDCLEATVNGHDDLLHRGQGDSRSRSKIRPFRHHGDVGGDALSEMVAYGTAVKLA